MLGLLPVEGTVEPHAVPLPLLESASFHSAFDTHLLEAGHHPHAGAEVQVLQSEEEMEQASGHCPILYLNESGLDTEYAGHDSPTWCVRSPGHVSSLYAL